MFLKFVVRFITFIVMLRSIVEFIHLPVLIVCDSWFGNDGLWSFLEREQLSNFQLLSRLQSHIVLYDLAPVTREGQSTPIAAPRKYSRRWQLHFRNLRCNVVTSIPSALAA